MAAIKVSSIKTSAYMSIEPRSNPDASLNHLSGSILSYQNQTQTNDNLISGQIVPNKIDSLPKSKIRIQKKNNQNKPLVNLNENLFARNDNNYVTTKAIIDESGKIERNYSYIEAMKEDIPSFRLEPQQKPPAIPQKTIKKGNTLPFNNSSKLDYRRANCKVDQNGIVLCCDTIIKPPLSIPSSSPSVSSPASSTKSSTMSQKLRGGNPVVLSTKNVTTSKQNTSSLSKSASQSSILTIFKNTFSPFAIRKWRSKSREKIIQKTELTTYDAVDGNKNTNPHLAKSREISPDMSNQQKNVHHKSIKNSHFVQQESLKNEQKNSYESGQKYQKNQATPNQIKLKTLKTKELLTTNISIDNHYYNNSIETPTETAYEIAYSKESTVVHAPSESPCSLFTTTKSKTTDSSMSSSLSSSSSSFVLPTPRNQPVLPPALPLHPPNVNASSINQINTFFKNLPSPKLDYEPRQRSERLTNLTCMLNGYISRQTNEDDLFNSQSTTDINLRNSENNNNGLTKSNRDSMNKSADVLNGSARFYDLKKKVYVSNSANITPKKVENLSYQQQLPFITINDNNYFDKISHKNIIMRADSLEDKSDDKIFENLITPQKEINENIDLIEMKPQTAVETTLEFCIINNINNNKEISSKIAANTSDQEVTNENEIDPVMIQNVNKCNNRSPPVV